MLSFSPKVFEFFFVYASDFLSEVDHIVGEGLKDVCLHVRPHDFDKRSLSSGQDWSDFAWLPCSSYSNLVRFVAIVFIAISSAAGSDAESGGAGPVSLVAPPLPQWLKDDLSAVRVEHVRRGGRQERTFHSLGRSCHEHSVARYVDPLMVDRLIGSLMDTAADREDQNPKIANLINKYNASVYFNEKLMLKDYLTPVQVALRDRTRWDL